MLPSKVPRLPFSRHEQLELSTAPEKTVDEKGCAAEYRFEACVWDSSVLVGLGVLSWQESLSVVLCGLWSVLVEGFFVLILCDNMTDTVFEDSLAQEMKEWRVQFGLRLSNVACKKPRCNKSWKDLSPLKLSKGKTTSSHSHQNSWLKSRREREREIDI